MTLGTLSYQGVSHANPGLKYTGDVATGYDAKRQGSEKWKVEQRIIEGMLSDLPYGSWVLDAPCGSGRWLDLCRQKGFIYRGIDVSDDMIQQAKAKLGDDQPIAELTQDDGKIIRFPQFHFDRANVLSCGAPDKSVDAALNIRITRWLSPQECQQMFKEMQRISRDRIIFTARVANHPHARSLELFEAAMADDWMLECSEAGSEKEYRIFMFRCKSSPLLTRKGEIIEAEKADDNAWTMKPYEAA